MSTSDSAPPTWYTDAFPPYPAKKADFHGTPEEQFFADQYYKLQEDMAKAHISPQEQSRALVWWNNASITVRKFGASSKEAASEAYKATEKWGKEHPVTTSVVSLIAGLGAGYGLAKA